MAPPLRFRPPAVRRLLIALVAALVAAPPTLAVDAPTPVRPGATSTATAEPDSRITRREAKADRALAAGRTAEALGHWATILCLDRDHPVGARLAAEAPARPALASPALDAARGALPARFRVVETAHFAILTDADPADVSGIERTLEDTRRAFTGFAARLGLEPMPIRHRLVCIVFDRHADFARFGREHDRVHATWCHGYYNPRYDRVALYVHGADDADGADSFAAQRRTVAAVHETVHQLSYHCLIQNAAVQYPLWLSEGLATSFETDDTGRRFGPGEPFEARERRLGDVVARGGLEPLDAFITRTSVGNADPASIESAYSQSYALFSWLMTTRPRDVRTLIESLQREPPGRVSPARQRELFESAFGPAASLRNGWEHHVRSRVRRLGGGLDPDPAFARRTPDAGLRTARSASRFTSPSSNDATEAAR